MREVKERIYESARASDYGTLKNLIDYHEPGKEELNEALNISCAKNDYKSSKYLISQGAEIESIKEESIKHLIQNDSEARLIQYLILHNLDTKLVDDHIDSAPVSVKNCISRAKLRKFMDEANKAFKDQLGSSQG